VPRLWLRHLVLALLLSSPIAATARASGTDGSVAVDPQVATVPGVDATALDEGEPRSAGASKVTPLIAPIPFKNSQIGWGLVLMLGAIHRFDPDSTLKPSTGAIGGFYTENKSWGLMAIEIARLAHDSWRLRGAYSHMDLRYDFFGIGEDAGDAGVSVPVGHKLDLGVGTALRRVAPGLYAGAGMLWMGTTLRLRGELPPEIASIDSDLGDTDLFAVGLQGEYDTRDDDYWPTRGSLAKLKGWFFTDGLGSARNFQRYMGGWTWYTQLPARRLVVAGNANLSAASGDVPFYALPSVGAGEYAFRGYEQGRYRDKVMVCAQAEARWHSSGRAGATAFAGFAQVAPSLGDLANALVLPAGGIGVRYQMTQQYPMHLRLDYAWGRNEGLLYFAVAEAF
jgi:hypothetical protein